MIALVRRFESAAAMLQAGLAGLCEALRQQQVRFQLATLETVLTWAKQSPPPDPAAHLQRRIALALEDDRHRKTQEIQALERDSAGYLAKTPYILLLSFPGVNVVSAADFAGEMGPIENYLTAKSITGRAGLFPSRYQSDQVDRPNGSLVRCANHLLRATIMNIADNLIGCNQYFRTMSAHWKAQGRDARTNHVRVAFRFCRIAFQIVAGRQVFKHPGMLPRHYILDKLNAFHREHHTGMAQVMADLLAAVGQVPRTAHAEEARPLREEHERIEAGRRRGPQLLGDILPIVLARLGILGVQSNPSGEVASAPPEPACEPRTPSNR
jgi:hypothetical protein